MVVLGLLGSACTRSSLPAEGPPTAETKAAAAEAKAAAAEAKAAADEPARPPARGCNPSTFERDAEGRIVWRIGDASVRFAATEELEADTTYHYRRRSIRIEAVDDPAVHLESACYPETDCGAPPPPDDPDEELWCLVSHGMYGFSAFFELIARHRPCEAPLDLFEGLVLQAPSPTCFRVGLPIYPGAAYEALGEQHEALVAAGIPQEVIERFDAHAEAAEHADRGMNDPEDNARAAVALDALRAALAPYTEQEAAWIVDVTAARALARVRPRYPYVLVGPGEKLYDVVSTETDPWTLAPTPAPWGR